MRLHTTRGVSELYASLLMVAVTLSFGSAASAAVLGELGTSASTASLSSSLALRALGTQATVVFSYVSAQGSCPLYKGAPEGTVLSLVVFDYGTAAFSPVLAAVNGTFYSATYPSSPAGGSAVVSIALAPSGTCAHQSGQTVMLADSEGGEVQYAT